MPFDPDKKVPRLNKNYSEIEDIEELSLNSFNHIANRIALCLFKVTEAIMNNYLVTNLTGTTPTNVKVGAIALGEDLDAGAASLILGTGNQHGALPSDSSVPGFELSLIVGDYNTVGNESTPSTVLGFNNLVRDRSDRSVVLGFDNTVGSSNPSIISFERNFVLGIDNVVGGSSFVTIGRDNFSSDGSTNGIAIGSGINLTGDVFTQPCFNNIALGTDVSISASDCIVFGNNAVIESGSFDSIAIGNSTFISGSGGIAIGYGTNITNASNVLAIGINAYVDASEEGIALGDLASVMAAEKAVQIGAGYNTVPYSLKYGDSELADFNLGLKLKKNSTAPAVTSNDKGAIALNNNVPQYVNDSGVWTNLGGGGGGATSIVYGVATTECANSYSGSGTSTVVYNSLTHFTPVGSTALPVTCDPFTGVVTFSQVGIYEITGVITISSSAAFANNVIFSFLNITDLIVSTGIFCRTIPTANVRSYIPVNFIVSVVTPGAVGSFQYFSSPLSGSTTLFSHSSPNATNTMTIKKVG